MGSAPTRSLDLMRAAQNGDREALDRLLRRYQERVRRIVRARLGQRLRARLDSGDILQEVFIAAVRTFDRFDVTDEASLIGWLSKITERQIHDAADRERAQKRSLDREVPIDGHATADGDDEGSIQLPDPAPLPADLLATREAAAIMDEALAELPELYRELILHRDYMGASWEAVAEATNRPSAAAARMMHGQALIELARLVRRKSQGGRPPRDARDAN